MQLKNVGNFSAVINEVKKLGTIYELSANSTKILESAFKGMTAAEIFAKTSTMELTEAQKLEMIQQFATDGANYATVESLSALSAAQTTAATSTTGLNTAFKGLQASLGTAKLVMMGAFAAFTIIPTIFRAIKQSQEELRQATAESANAYKETSSSIFKQNLMEIKI